MSTASEVIAPPLEASPNPRARRRSPSTSPAASRIYVNRNLRLDKIEMVGFDMDYTLALYNQARIEELSMRATLDKLVTAKGTPRRSAPWPTTRCWRCAAWWSTTKTATSSSRTAMAFLGARATGSRTSIASLVAELYQRERTRLSSRRYAWIDSLFALPEAVLYAVLVDYFDRHDPPGKPDYTALWEHIRECIDLAHRDGSIKAIVSADFPSYVERDEALAETLHKFRSSGKRLFLLTNSAWDYTSAMMSYLLDGARTASRIRRGATTSTSSS